MINVQKKLKKGNGSSKVSKFGAEKKPKLSGGPAFWEYEGKHHLRDCTDLNESEPWIETKVGSRNLHHLQRRKGRKPRVASILGHHLDTEAWIERKVRYLYTFDSEAFTTIIPLLSSLRLTNLKAKLLFKKRI